MYEHNKELAGPVISLHAVRSADFSSLTHYIIEMMILSQSLSLLLMFSFHLP